MLAGGLVEPNADQPGAVVAYVAMSVTLEGSRMFKLAGPPHSPTVTELPAATTIDLNRMHKDVAAELEPAISAIVAVGGDGTVGRPDGAWAAGLVRDHIEATKG
jgi:hypothetical protein